MIQKKKIKDAEYSTGSGNQAETLGNIQFVSENYKTDHAVYKRRFTEVMLTYA